MITKRFIIPLFATLLTLAFSTISAKTIAIIGNVSDTLKAELATSEIDTTAGEGKVFYIVEKMPDFTYKEMHGIGAFRNYVQDNLKWPAVEDDVQGRIYISFIIETDGHISTIKTVKSLDIRFDNEAIRVIAHAPKWTPGKQKGKPARVTFTIPVTFQLQ